MEKECANEKKTAVSRFYVQNRKIRAGNMYLAKNDYLKRTTNHSGVFFQVI